MVQAWQDLRFTSPITEVLPPPLWLVTPPPQMLPPECYPMTDVTALWLVTPLSSPAVHGDGSSEVPWPLWPNLKLLFQQVACDQEDWQSPFIKDNCKEQHKPAETIVGKRTVSTMSSTFPGCPLAAVLGTPCNLPCRFGLVASDSTVKIKGSVLQRVNVNRPARFGSP